MNRSGSPWLSTGMCTSLAIRASFTALPAPPWTALLVDGDQELVGGCHLDHHVDVQRLHEAHVDDGRVQGLRRLERVPEHRPEGEQCNAFAAAAALRFADRQCGHSRLHRHARPGASRIAHRTRLVELEAGVEHLSGLVLVGRRHDDDVRQAAQVGDVVGAGVGGSVTAHHPGAINGEEHRQALDHHVVNDLVVRALQEGRVDCDHRLQSVTRHSRRDGDTVLLGNADIEVALWELCREALHLRSFAHRGCDPHHSLVDSRHVAQPFTEHLRVGRLVGPGRWSDPDVGIERGGYAVIPDRIRLRRRVALAFLGDDVQQLGTVERLQVADGGHQCRQIVAVYRPDVVEAELLEQGSRDDQPLDMLLRTARELPHRRHSAQHFLAAFSYGGVELSREHPGEVIGQGADVRRDRHLVVVEHHQHVGAEAAGVVERLEGHAAGQAAVADYRHHPPIRSGALGRHRHADGGADRSAGMADAEGVVPTFGSPREGREAPPLANARQPLPPPGEGLVRIGLVAHVPDDAVLGGVVQEVQRHRQLDRAQTGREVAGGLRHTVDEQAAQLAGDRGELRLLQLSKIRRGVDLLEKRVTVFGH